MHSAVIVGAGAFGASLAWRLARAGTRVTLVDQFEPGDPRTTSGGESRLIRCGHGPDRDYTASARRARTLWRELEAESGEQLLVECGLTWFAHADDGWEARTIATFEELAIPYERLAPEAGARLFPSFSPAGLAFLLHEPEAGVLRAQRAVRALARQAVAHGAELIRGVARPDGAAARLADGRVLEADVVVWACGAWLGPAVRRARRDPRDAPGAVLLRRRPGLGRGGRARVRRLRRGDLRHPRHRRPRRQGRARPRRPADRPRRRAAAASAAGEAVARRFLAERFPALGAAPLSGSKCCRYELSPDSHFVAAPHPEHASVWLLGGGSGHGFKHGPALAEQLAPALAGTAPPPARFALGDRSARSLLRTGGAR